MVAVLRIAALAAVLALYVHVVRAVVMDGRLAFVSDDVDGPLVLGKFTVFDGSGRRVWAFQSYPVFGSVRFRGLGTTPLAFVVGV